METIQADILQHLRSGFPSLKQYKWGDLFTPGTGLTLAGDVQGNVIDVTGYRRFFLDTLFTGSSGTYSTTGALSVQMRLLDPDGRLMSDYLQICQTADQHQTGRRRFFGWTIFGQNYAGGGDGTGYVNTNGFAHNFVVPAKAQLRYVVTSGFDNGPWWTETKLLVGV